MFSEGVGSEVGSGVGGERGRGWRGGWERSVMSAWTCWWGQPRPGLRLAAHSPAVLTHGGVGLGAVRPGPGWSCAQTLCPGPVPGPPCWAGLHFQPRPWGSGVRCRPTEVAAPRLSGDLDTWPCGSGWHTLSCSRASLVPATEAAGPGADGWRLGLAPRGGHVQTPSGRDGLLREPPDGSPLRTVSGFP